MAVYVIGDIHGCYKTLMKLLNQFDFNPTIDKLLLIGDLVNKGNFSLEVLRWAKNLNNKVISILGNHDLYLLTIYAGLINNYKNIQIQNILKANDINELMSWLIKRPLIHVENNYILVHAGILPSWTLSQALIYAKTVQKTLRSNHSNNLLKIWNNITADEWSDNLIGYKKMATILNVFTKIRFLKTSNKMDFNFKCNPKKAPKKLTAWFNFCLKKNQEYTIIFGHWSTLGIRCNKNFLSLDSGCVFGQNLTAIRLEDKKIFSQKNLE